MLILREMDLLAQTNFAHTENAARYAERWGVNPAIHAEDHIFNFIAQHPSFPSDDQRISYYFDDGARSSSKFLKLLSKYHLLDSNPKVLEFASGYGCVSRHLAEVDDIQLTSCDIHIEATDFLQNKLNIPTCLSSSIPELLFLPTHYDVVFALSFFSHMPITTWARWLVKLSQCVEPGGLLMFTAHGNASKPYLGNPTLNELGFWYKEASEQHDLPTENYGLTISSPDFVRRHISSIPWMTLEDMSEAAWWNHQDLYIVRRHC